MLKGTTTIKLFDAKTGKLQKEHKEENLVTNAVQNVFWIPYAVRSLHATSNVEATGTGNGWESMIRNQNKPFYEKAYGCISLFRDNHELDVNNVMMSGRNKLVGYAGDAGTKNESDLLCGERNATESGTIDNGYRFVWDFGTERANGTIRSVSLGLTDISKFDTTRAGNCIGFNCLYNCGPSAANTSRPAIDWAVSWFTVSGIKNNAGGTPIITQTVYLDVDANNDIVVYVVAINQDAQKYPFVQIDKITLRAFEKLSVFDTDNVVVKKYETLVSQRLPNSQTETIATNVNLNNRHNIQIDDDKNIHIIYFADFRQSGSTYIANQFVHTIYSLSGVMISSKKISFPSQRVWRSTHGLSGNIPCGYYGNLYYGLAPSADGSKAVLQRFNESGVVDESELAAPMLPNETHMTAFSVTESGIAQVSYSNAYSGSYVPECDFYTTDPEKSVLLQRANNGTHFRCIQHNIATIKKPFSIRCSYTRGSTSPLYIVASPHYLGTINNFDAPITKTNAQTMKVIYELVEVKE